MKKMNTIIILCIIMFFFPSVIYADDYNEEAPSSSIFDDECIDVFGEEEPDINARSAIVVDYDSGRVLYEKNAYLKRPMASTTKIMTAIVAIENGTMDDKVNVSRNAVSIWGSTMHLSAGEELTLRELMYGLLLPSGNDASLAIAEHIGGSVEGFVEMMNRKAKEIGALNTHFSSPHGLDATGHYTTACDMALMTRYALKIPLFNEIVRTKSVWIGNRFFNNTNEMLTNYDGADGVKTGYTGKAGRCLVTSATRDDRRFISVVLFCDSRAQRALSSKKILDYTFSWYYHHTLLQSEYLGTIPVYKGYEKSVPVYVEKNITMPLTDSELKKLYTKVTLYDTLAAPVEEKVVVGNISIYLEDKILCESSIRTGKSIKQKKLPEFMLDVFINWLKLMKYEAS